MPGREVGRIYTPSSRTGNWGLDKMSEVSGVAE